MRRDRGVALVVVLAITGVLGLLILQLGLMARQQVDQARTLADRAEAELRLRSREAALLYSLLTRERNADPRQVAEDNPYAASWNFRGDPFEVDGVTIRLQDMTGLFSMPLPGSSTAELASLLAAIGVEQSRAEQAARSLQQSLSVPPRLPLQSLQELGPIAGLTAKEINQLEEVATLYPVSSVNPATAPEPVLATKYSGITLEGVLSSRREGGLDAQRLQSLTGTFTDDALISFLVGPGFRVDISIDHRGVRLRRQSTWTVRPANPVSPLELWSYRSLDSSPSLATEAGL